METIKLASPQTQEMVKDLRTLRGIAQILAITIAVGLGNISDKGCSRNRRLPIPIFGQWSTEVH